MIALRRSKKATLSLDMAPLIDVVFQLLIFFMLTASFAEPAMKLNLPRAAFGQDVPPAPIVLSVTAQGEVFLKDRAVLRSRLTETLRQELARSEQKTVSLRGQEDMPYKFFVEIMDMARQAGAGQINILHQKKE